MTCKRDYNITEKCQGHKSKSIINDKQKTDNWLTVSYFTSTIKLCHHINKSTF